MRYIIERIISLTILIIAYVTLNYVITIDCYDLNNNSDKFFSNNNFKRQQQQEYQQNSNSNNNNNNNNQDDESIEMLTIEPERWQQTFSTTPETDNYRIGNNDGSLREDERSSTPSNGRMRRRRLGKKRKRMRQQQVQSSTHYDEITEGQIILNEENDNESTRIPESVAGVANTRRRKKQNRGRDNDNPENNFRSDREESVINTRLRDRDYEELIPEQTTVYRHWNKNADHPERRPPPKYERTREPVDRDRQLNELRERHRQRDELATATEHNKSYRRPYSASRREEQGEETGNSGSSDLKAILKQSGGLSLSEILQQRNLSLADLLKGKQNALAALTPTIPNPTVSFDVNENGDHLPIKTVRRLPGATLTTNSYNSESANSWQPSDDAKPPRRLPTFNATPKPSNDLSQKTETDSQYNSPIRRISPPQLSITSTTTTTTTTTQEPEIDTELVATKATQVEETKNAFEDTSPSQAALHPPSDYIVTEIAPTIALQSKDTSKPIREIVSGIRPDLSNSKRRLPFPKLRTSTISAMEPTVGIEVTSTASLAGKPQRWEDIGKNLLNRDRIRNIGKVENVTTIEMKDDKTELETETAVQVVGSLNEEIITSVQPVLAEPQSVPDVQIIRDLKNRPPFRPRLRQPRPTTSTEPNTTPASSAETENYPRRPIIRPIKKDDSAEEKINKSETNANIIEKFSTFKETKQKDVASIEEIFDGIHNKDITSRSDEDLGSENSNTKSLFVLTNQTTKQQLDVTERNPSLFADITSIRSPVDDRTDLLELLGDRRSGGRLAKVLAQRNMSFDELIEHRQRGSSQLHLAEIFHNSNSTNENDFIKTTINLPHLTPQQQRKDKRLGYDIVTAFDNFPNFNLDNIKSVRPDDIKTDSQGSSYFATIINIRPTDEIKKVNHLSQQLTPPMSSASSPLSNEQSWNLDTTNYRPNHRPVLSSQSPTDVIVPTSLTSDRLNKQKLNINDDILQRVEQIENEVARANDLLEFDLNIGQDTRKTTAVTVETAHLPIGVKSAIVASGCIVGISLLIFVIIFVVCRIRQRRRTKLNYNESYQTTTKSGHLPILQREMSHRNMLNDNALAFHGLPTNINSNHQMSMNCGGLTLNGSRCSKLNTMDPNSPEVQDYLFDAMRKPFQ